MEKESIQIVLHFKYSNLGQYEVGKSLGAGFA